MPPVLPRACTVRLRRSRVGLHTGYDSHVLPSLIVTGVGMGMVFAPAMATATGNVRPEDAGVASALVNTMQQVGGSIGVALLSTLSATATTSFIASHGGPTAGTVAAAAVHGYTTAFWWAAGIFFLGALPTSLLLRSGTQRRAPEGVLALAH
jgi:hypothetical protein